MFACTGNLKGCDLTHGTNSNQNINIQTKNTKLLNTKRYYIDKLKISVIFSSYGVHCAMYNVHCTVYIVQDSVYGEH